MIKTSFYQGDIRIINTYAQGSPQIHEVKMTEIKREVYNSIIIVGDFHTSISIIDRTTRRKINKEIEDLNTINLLDLIDIYRTLHTWIEYAVF